MLATGGSATAAIEVLKKWGAVRIKLVNLIAAPEGVEAVLTAHPDVEIYTRSPRPPAQREGYIMPGSATPATASSGLAIPADDRRLVLRAEPAALSGQLWATPR